ncbi:hypothetical protein Q0590_24310 [Rhodocytophaga aerolata]|uniref:SoxR reducing system RseC family protein n=1 Tax=Rhodocytophaga aerolata TaxID=455078 RepID=A0ABT8RBD8_9BACT|nr:hypothetical protein [Rhodocytophaga aerolata]MDO1449421.1 hypothetical protein [Rhodocytophaga aerolata]
MIPLSTRSFYLEGVTPDFFWKELDKITVGQSIDPEFGYTTPHFGKFDNVFGGRKVKNSFSVFLYRPISQLVRTEILAKGTVEEKSSGIRITCRFEYPFWSLLMLILLGSMLVSPFYMHSLEMGFMATLFGLFLYSLLVVYNHANIKQELSNQLKLLEQKAKKEIISPGF